MGRDQARDRDGAGALQERGVGADIEIDFALAGSPLWALEPRSRVALTGKELFLLAVGIQARRHLRRMVASTGIIEAATVYGPPHAIPHQATMKSALTTT